MMQFCEFITPTYTLQLKIFLKKRHIPLQELSNIILHVQFKGYLLIVSWNLMVKNLIVNLSFNHSFVIIWISNLRMENSNSSQNLKIFSIGEKVLIWTRFDIVTFITEVWNIHKIPTPKWKIPFFYILTLVKLCLNSKMFSQNVSLFMPETWLQTQG